MRRTGKARSPKELRGYMMIVHGVLALAFVVACVVCYGAAVPFATDDNLF